MLRVAVIVSLAFSAMAAVVDKSDKVPEEVIRAGSLGASFLNVKGILEPISGVGQMPSFIFKYIVDGVPVEEKEKVNFHCSKISGLTVPHGDTDKPVLMCRSVTTGRSGGGEPIAAFLLSAEQLSRPGDLVNMYLSLGNTMLHKLQESQGAILSLVRPMIPIPDKGKGLRMDDLKDVKKPTLDIPTRSRVKRQFGLGFSGSGAQASSSSFGGGGGFGGFPGGGFGGGFSGSQASAGSSSFGGGGGFFG